MATAHASRSYPAFGNTQVDASDVMADWVDFNAIQSPGPSTRPASRLPISQQADSSITSPASTIVPYEEDFHSAKPSHDYSQFKQQTGIPTGTLGLSAVSQPYSFDGFNSGLGVEYLDGSFDGMNAGLSGMDVDLTPTNNGLPAFFFPGDANTQADDFVDPSSISAQDEPQANVRFFPGMHKQKAQQAALAKAQEQARQMHRHQILQAAQQQQQQSQQQKAQQQSPEHVRSQSNAKRGSTSHPDARVEEIIGRVVNQIRNNSHSSGHMGSPGMPQAGRLRKSEEDMDEDERLLASEEGKKLSSKERRQLRNKVSARAFRSRRKEYIGQLESEVAGKASECNELRLQNHALLEENARSRAFIEKLLRHQAFVPFLEDLSRDPSIMESLPKLAPPAPQPTLPSSQEFNTAPEPSSQALQVGMTMIPETPMDISMLNLGSNDWNNIAIPGFNGFQHNPQIYAVLELPEAPPMPDFAALSEKPRDFFTSQFVKAENVKADYPVIERPTETSTEETAARAPTFENPEDFELYTNSPAAAPTPSSFAPFFENLNLPSPKSTQFKLVVLPAASEEELMLNLEKMCETLDESVDRFRGLSGL